MTAGNALAGYARSTPLASELLDFVDLHRRAPGVIGAIFSPDGNFEGAPTFTCWLWNGQTYCRVDVPSLAFIEGPDGSLELGERGRDGVRVGPYALDARIPSVAIRLWHLLAVVPQFSYAHEDIMRMIQALHAGDAIGIKMWASTLAGLFRTWAPEVARMHRERRLHLQAVRDVRSTPD